MRESQKMIIFYFSGTGNAKTIASWFLEFASEKGISTQLVNIADKDYSPLENMQPDSLIGIISPIHGFNFPKVTLDFIRGIPSGNNKILLMNTRAGLKLHRFVTPGLTGVAFMLSSLILKRKGYTIIGEIPFDMPSNWISVHPALREKAVQYIFQKNHSRVKVHFDRIYSGKNDFVARKDIIQDVLISPIALAYYFIGKYFLAKSFYASHKCINCNLCIKQCPVQAVKKENERPYWTFKCESCMKCMNNCPVDAIETPHGLWILVIYATSILCTFILYNLLSVSSQHWLVEFTLFNVLLVALMFLFYRIQQFLLRYPFVAKLISYTSLTRYKFWGRYKAKNK